MTLRSAALALQKVDVSMSALSDLGSVRARAVCPVEQRLTYARAVDVGDWAELGVAGERHSAEASAGIDLLQESNKAAAIAFDAIDKLHSQDLGAYAKFSSDPEWQAFRSDVRGQMQANGNAHVAAFADRWLRIIGDLGSTFKNFPPHDENFATVRAEELDRQFRSHLRAGTR